MTDDLSPLTLFGPLTLLPPSAVTFLSQGRTVLKITYDGRIEVCDGFEPDEAGRKAIDGMRHQLSFIIQAAVEAEREACAVAIETKFMETRDTEFDLGFETARKVFAAVIRNSNMVVK